MRIVRPMAGKSAEEFYQNLEPLKEGDELFFGRQYHSRSSFSP